MTASTEGKRETVSIVESRLPVVRWARSYDRAWLRLDVVAGLTVAAAMIPEGLAYASLANLPPQTGLYAGFFATIVYVFLGTSRQVIVGPTSALSILVAAGVGALVATPDEYAAMVALTAVLVGIMYAVAWLLRLGFLVNFISESVITGFAAGAGIFIASTQLGKLFGISGSSGVFYDRVWFIVQHLGETNLPTLAVGVGGLLLLFFGERYFPSLPNALVVVLLSIGLMSVTGLRAAGVSVTGAIPSGLPALTLPTVSLASVESLLQVAAACFLLSYVYGVGAVQTFARKHEYRTDNGQELLANGVANVAAGLGQGFPVGGSMTRSALNDEAGGRTQLAGGVAAVGLGVVLLFLTGVFTNLPDTILASVILVAAWSLVDVGKLRRIYRIDRIEFAVAMATLLGVLVFGILYGIFVGVAGSLLVVIGRMTYPHTAVLGRIPGTENFGNLGDHPEYEQLDDVLVYRVNAELFYANAQTIEDELIERVAARESPPELVVFDLSASPKIDLTAMDMLHALSKRLAARGIALRLAEASDEVCDILRATGLEEGFGGISPNTTIAAVIDEWHSPSATE